MDELWTPQERKALQKLADTCARCNPLIAKLRAIGASVEEEAARKEYAERMLLQALGYENSTDELPPK